MNINYYNFRLICGRVFFLANGLLREAIYGVEKADLSLSPTAGSKSADVDNAPG